MLYLPAGVELDGAKLEFVTNGVPPDPYEQRIIEAGAIQPRGGHVDEDETPFEAQLADFNPGAMRRALCQVMQNGPCEVPGCFVCTGQMR